MSFAAKVDLWFLLLFYGSGALMILFAPTVYRRPRGPFAAGMLVALGFLFMCVAWRASIVEFVLTEDGYLDATGFPFDGRIGHVRSIERVEPSNDPRASHAASLDRLRVDLRGAPAAGGQAPGIGGGVIFIAVEEEEAFLDALAAKDDALVRTSTGIRRMPHAHGSVRESGPSSAEGEGPVPVPGHPIPRRGGAHP